MAGDYRDLIAWKKALRLVLAIYRATSKFPSEEKFGLTAQLRRAGISVPSNIAEGQGRNSRGEFLHHLRIALGSLKEVETQLLISIGLGYLRQDQTSELMTLVDDVGRLINGLSKSLRSHHEPRTTNHEPRTTNHEPLTTNH